MSSLRRGLDGGRGGPLQEAWDIERAAAALEGFLAEVGRGMLFMRALRRVRLQRWDADAPAASPLRQVPLTGAALFPYPGRPPLRVVPSSPRASCTARQLMIWQC